MEKYLLTEDAIAVQVVERHYSVREVADLLKVGLDFVYDRLKSGELAPVVELGDSRAKQRIPASALQRFLDARTFDRST